jgi:hypothetical protein
MSKSQLTSRKHSLNPQKILIGTQNTGAGLLTYTKGSTKRFLIGTEIAFSALLPFHGGAEESRNLAPHFSDTSSVTNLAQVGAHLVDFP